MKFGIRFRIIALATGITLMGLVIGLMTVRDRKRTDELRVRLSRVDSESFRIADQFRDFLRDLNNSLYEFGSRFDPADRDKFQSASHQLDLWIDEQKPKLTTDRERSLMQQIDVAFDDYLRTARALPEKLQTYRPGVVPITAYDELRQQSLRLFDLGQSLAKAHFASRIALQEEANLSLSELQLLVLVSLGALFLFGVALAWVVYREMIAPLQTKLVESQVLLERQEKLASLGMLAAGVAHEIRNPLTAIKAALFIQQKKFQPGTPEHADGRVVEREILRLERIVNDFLLFARPSEPNPAAVNADELLREVQALLAPELGGRNVQLLVEPGPRLSLKIDAAQIKQVLINLIRNGADAIAENGVIKLRARPDRKWIGSHETDVVILEVSDNGKGIPPQIQKRLFDPFFTTKESGTGLGLCIAAGIVHKHGGALQYQTQVDCGTTFGIILPQATA
jgi:signal transduction histidine kinase